MLKRRVVLLTGTALAAAPAAAQRRPPPRRGRPPEPQMPTVETPVGTYGTLAKFAFVTDFTTGATLLDKEADQLMAPSSMAKLMTAYIVYSRLKAGKLRLDQELTVSDKAWRMQGSKMFVPQGGSVKVEDLIRGMIIQSGNDACIVLAEGIAGSEDQFADLMNQTAKELGLTKSTFRNCNGWPDANQRMTCRDIAMLAKRIISDFPEYYAYDNEKSFKYNNISQENRNPLVQKGVADGLKTGHTEEGGYGLVASAKHGDRRIILVINGCTSMKQRAEEGGRMLDWAFGNYENVTLFGAGDTVDSAAVWLGTRPTVPLVGGRDLVVTMPKDWRGKAKVLVEFDSPIAAPVDRGAVLGRLTVKGDGVPSMEVPLLAGADVPRMSLPGRALAVLSRYTLGA